MRTRYIPAGVMLLAGAVTCIISIVKKEDGVKSLITLLAVLILFYIIGLIAKYFVEKILKDFKEHENKTMTDVTDEGEAESEEEPSDVGESHNMGDNNRL